MLLMVLERDGNKEVNLAAQEAGHMDTLEKSLWTRWMLSSLVRAVQPSLRPVWCECHSVSVRDVTSVRY